MSVHVLITGLVRDRERLLNKLAQFENWQQRDLVDKIVFCTWIGEVDKYPGLRKLLNESSAELIEIESPKLVLKGGHQLHQMLSLYYGLQALHDNESFVLKTRVDLADNIEAMTFDFLHRTEKAEDFLQVGLENKILVEYSQILFPFLMGDAQFFGKVRDLRKLVNLSTEMELVYCRLAVEQTFFFHPFKDIAIFQRHFFWNVPHIADQQIRRELQLSFLAKSEYFNSLVTAWMVVLNSYFKIGWGPESNQPGDMTLDQIYRGESEILIGPDGSFLIQSSDQVRAILANLDKAVVSSAKAALRETGANPLFVDEPIKDELEEFRKKFTTLNKPRVVLDSQSKPKTISGPIQHFFVSEDNDTVAKYQEQITYLRRENDALQRQLGTSTKETLLHRFLISRFRPETLLRLKSSLPKVFIFYQKHIWWK